MFSPPVYLSVGDEYDKRQPRDNTAMQGKKQFVVTARKNPHITDSVFGGFNSVSAGDPYKEQSIHGPFRQRDPTEDKQTQPFKPPSVSKKSEGKGNYYGTFCEGKPYKHQTEFPPIRSDKDAPLKNFYTNPPKKGTYGYSGLTIAKTGEIVYVADPFEGNKRKEALEKKEATTSQMGAPFKPAVRTGGCFDDSERGFTTVYSLTKPLPPKKEKPKELDNIAAKPWVPGGALTKEITKIPEYQEDPYDVRERKIREKKLEEKKLKAWYPVGNDPYRHIYHKPIQFDPPAIE
eukprot:gene638-355_t